MSACASSSVIGSSEIADHMPRPARSSRAWRNGLAAVSSLRKHNTVSIAGGLGGRSSSSSRTTLSASAHCRSSIQITSGWRSRQPAQQLAQRLECAPPKTKRVDAHRGSGPHARWRWRRTCSITGNTRVNAGTSGGISRSTSLAWNRREIAAQVVDRRRRAPCKARTRFRSSGRRARRHRRAWRTGGESAERARSCRCLTDRGHDTASASPLTTASKASFNA